MIDQFNDEDWVLPLDHQLTAMVMKYYNGITLTGVDDGRLFGEMADELSAKRGSYTFFRTFSDNWFAYKLLQSRYKTHCYQRDRIAKGI